MTKWEFFLFIEEPMVVETQSLSVVPANFGTNSNPPASAFQVLGLQACTTMLGSDVLLPYLVFLLEIFLLETWLPSNLQVHSTMLKQSRYF